MRQLIFVVDGQAEVRQLARQTLESAGYGVHTFWTGDVIAEAEAERPCLVLMSLLLPEGSGLAWCRRLRENLLVAQTPVVFLLDDGVEEQRSLALEAGGDDCLMKPFSPRELAARVQAVLRRSLPHAVPSPSTPADLLTDSWAMKLLVRGNEVPTTTLEFRLIEYLARHRGQVFTRDVLLDAVWGDLRFVTPRSVDSCVRRIREKIEPDRTQPVYLKTVRGVGYRLDAVTAWQAASIERCDCIACTSGAVSSRLHCVNGKRRARLARS